MTEHWSDCATHNAPALPPGECDCGAEIERLRKENAQLRDELLQATHGDCLCPECFKPDPPKTKTAIDAEFKEFGF